MIVNPGSKETALIQGAGLVLRLPHLDQLLLRASNINEHKLTEPKVNWPKVNWIELLGDNFLCPHLPVLLKIDELRKSTPFVLHLTGLSLASFEPLNLNYLKKIDALVERYNPAFISDHLCWSSFNGSYSHDLLPFPFTHKALVNISEKIKILQDRWQRPFLVENISSYLNFSPDQQDYSEVEFLNALVKNSGVSLLLDINNIYVSCMNHGDSYTNFIDQIDLSAVKQIHLAGFSKKIDLLIDTHSKTISDEVWALFLSVIQKAGKIPSVLEWDQDLPPLPILLEETQKISAVLERQLCPLPS